MPADIAASNKVLADARRGMVSKLTMRIERSCSASLLPNPYLQVGLFNIISGTYYYVTEQDVADDFEFYF